jgi:hypothetical protein
LTAGVRSSNFFGENQFGVARLGRTENRELSYLKANETRASADAVLPQQTSHLTAIERWVGKKRSDRLASAEFLAKGPLLSPGYC